jgi:hypothetical protein
MIAVAPIKRAWLVINCVIEMKTPNRERELVLLSKTALMSEKALEKELISLEQFFVYAESETVFCQTHQLVKRNRITSKKTHLVTIFYTHQLKPFWFLVNKN